MNFHTTFKNLNRYALSISVRHVHSLLQTEISNKIPLERTRITNIRRSQNIDQKDLNKIYNGLNGYKDLVWGTSQLDNEHELVFRGYSLPQLLQELPKLDTDTVPTVEGHFWLLMTGKLPTAKEVQELITDWEQRATIPFYIEKLIRELPPTTEPIKLITSAIDLLKSKFIESYANGIFKDKYWEMVLEDLMDLIAKVPTIVAMVYNKLYKRKTFLPMHNPRLDWAANFAIKLGVRDKVFQDLIRLYMIVYSDLHDNHHEYSDCISGPAFSDPYKNYVNGIETLTSIESRFKGHEYLKFLKQVQNQVGPNPNESIIAEYIHRDFGTQIPGFGHVDFHTYDPRLKCLLDFAARNNINGSLFYLSQLVNKVVPDVLKSRGVTQNSIPNVDTVSSVLLHSYGITEEQFHPVLYATARSLGLFATYIWDRALGAPCDKTKSLSSTEKSVEKKEVPFQSISDVIKSKKKPLNILQKCAPSNDIINDSADYESNVSNYESNMTENQRNNTSLNLSHISIENNFQIQPSINLSKPNSNPELPESSSQNVVFTSNTFIPASPESKKRNVQHSNQLHTANFLLETQTSKTPSVNSQNKINKFQSFSESQMFHGNKHNSNDITKKFKSQENKKYKVSFISSPLKTK